MLCTEHKLKGVKTLAKTPNYLAQNNFQSDAIIFELGGLYDFKNTLKTYKHINNCNSDTVNKESDWTGCRTWDLYEDLLENGDEDVIKKIKLETSKQVAELGKKYEDVISNYKFDVVGQFFDVGLVLTGVPETWLEPEYQQEEKVRVDILINGTFSDGTDLNKISKNAGKILAMVKILEEHNVEVSLKMIFSSIKSNTKNSGQRFVAVANVKDYDEAINYAKCSSLMSPTFLRRGMIKILELIFERKLASGYGKPEKLIGVMNLDDNNDISNLEQKLFKRGVK